MREVMLGRSGSQDPPLYPSITSGFDPRDDYRHEDEANFCSVLGGTGGKPGTCAGCKDLILDRYYLLAVEKQWHASCLVCTACRLPLDSQVTCFAKDGNIYCKEDYYRLFVLKSCSQCRRCISADELVMRVRDYIYHIQCFTCAICAKQLNTGEHFGLSDHLIFCQRHYESLLQGEFMYHHTLGGADPLSPLPPLGFTGEGVLPPPNSSLGYFHSPNSSQSASMQKGRPRKRKNISDAEHFIPSLVGDEMMGMSHEDLLLQHPRQKRMRTSFKHHQLRIMKSYFSLNHNPDAKDLKQLAQKTGLSKRVLQVWFQNARAKHRRTVVKETDKTQQRSNSNNSNNNSNSSNSSNTPDCGTGNGGDSGGMRPDRVDSREGSTLARPCHDEHTSNDSPSPPLSDISNPSLTMLEGRRMIRLCGVPDGRDVIAQEHTTSGSGLSEIFSSTLRAIH